MAQPPLTNLQLARAALHRGVEPPGWPVSTQLTVRNPAQRQWGALRRDPWLLAPRMPACPQIEPVGSL
jgi:hypothetical protein